MFKTAAILAFATLVLLAAQVTPAPAIAIFSDASLTTCTSGSQACSTVFNVTGTLPWGQGNNPGGSNAVWVSYAANTNAEPNGPAQAPDVNPGSQTVRFFQDLGSTGGSLSLNIWADDTAGVGIDGAAFLISPNAGPYPHCADGAGSVGCDVGEQGVLNVLLAPGPHTVYFDVFQGGPSGSPFGLLYAGTFDLTPVPEPATILLLGSALIAAGVFSRRRLRKSNPAA